MNEARRTDGAGPAAPERAGLAGLSPSNFALVMATGIVSLAAHEHGLEIVALALFWFNVLAWVLLWCLNVLRMLRYPRLFFGDMADHLRGPGFFASVAGTAVLGAQVMILVAGGERIAFALWVLALALWAALTYVIFAAFTIKEVKPTLDKGISGGWLLAVVAAQSLAVLGALLAAQAPQHWRLELNFFALTMWLWGGMLYIWTMSLIFYRYMFFHFTPDDLTPPYWINMGAMAISTLAGSLLIVNAPGAPLLASLLPFLKGFTVFYWVTGSWWVPLLLVLEVWDYVYKRTPLNYSPLNWGAVFPLGMYSVSTDEMLRGLSIHFLDFVPPVFLYLALVAWIAACAGLIHQLVRRRIRGAD